MCVRGRTLGVKCEVRVGECRVGEAWHPARAAILDLRAHWYSITTPHHPWPAALACDSADSLAQPLIAGASRTSVASSSAATMNCAKSTRRTQLLARMGSPT